MSTLKTKYMDPDTAQQIRLLRQSLLDLRQHVTRQLNAFDQRLAAMEPEEGVPSEQFPRTRKG